MLTQLTLHNFAISQAIDIEFNGGLSVLTGETGAGKSISLDALNLAIGARADSKMVKAGCSRAEIHAVFDISQHPRAQQWLQQRELEVDNNECILRRVVNKDGRSRAYLNGRPSSISEIQAIAALLVNIHGQHAQQHLLQRQQQRELLDRFAQSSQLLDQIKALHHNWHTIQKDIQLLIEDEKSLESQRELLTYQLQELDQLALEKDELAALEREQLQLSQADTLLLNTQQALDLCNSDDDHSDLLNMLNKAQQLLEPFAQQQLIADSQQLLEQAQINIEEASHNLRDFQHRFNSDPERLQHVQQRLDIIYQLARKHRVEPAELHAHHQTLARQLKQLDQRELRQQLLETQAQTIFNDYKVLASRLSDTRRKAAKKLQRIVNKQLFTLHMPEATFEINFETHEQQKPNAYGFESAQFLISTHPQSPPASLKDIASGGELSRISLAIEVALQASTQVPTLIFDEVDAGIGGATAEVVGQLLRDLGSAKQIICVTHQAQLAAQAHHHYKVSKYSQKKSKTTKNIPSTISTSVELLDAAHRIEEISRMIGGVAITQKTRDHAQELLQSA